MNPAIKLYIQYFPYSKTKEMLNNLEKYSITVQDNISIRRQYVDYITNNYYNEREPLLKIGVMKGE